MEEEINVTRSFLPPMEEYIQKISKIWENHVLTNMGSLQCEFQDRLREYLEAPYCTLFCNGHMSLELLLSSMKLTGEVITTPFTFVSTTHAIVRNGLTPVFCDIHPEDYTLDERKLESLITDKTSAILPVHVYGAICHTEEIERIARKHGLKVIYDAAHAFGVRKDGKSISQQGDAVMYSFHATKPFHSIEGGAVVCKDQELADKLDYMRNFGIINEEEVEETGTNAKMNEFQAAMGICNMKYLDEIFGKRKKAAMQYRERLSDLEGVQLPPVQTGIESNYAYFPVLFNPQKAISRDAIKAGLDNQGIHTRKYFYPITNEFACYRNRYRGNTPIARQVSSQVLTLPIYDSLAEEMIDRICSEIRRIIMEG